MKKTILILITVLMGCLGFYFYTYTHNAHKTKHSLHKVANNVEMPQWVKFTHKDEYFSAFFPKTPTASSRNLLIPGSDNCLPYTEFICTIENEVLFSVSYTTLPDGWLKYGNNLVLGSALKAIMKELGTTQLVAKDSTVFKSFPALDYEHYTVAKSKQRESAGILILVGNVLYKVEMVYPLELQHQNKDHLTHFIANFTPNKVDVISSQPENSTFDTPQSQ